MEDEETTLSQIFATDPLELTKPDLQKVVAFFREQRKRFNMTGKAAAPKKEKKSGGAVTQLTLGELGL